VAEVFGVGLEGLDDAHRAVVPRGGGLAFHGLGAGQQLGDDEVELGVGFGASLQRSTA
jgi:hypothetical protein